MAEQNEQLSAFENSLCFSLRACQLGIVINSSEEKRVLTSIIRASQTLEEDSKKAKKAIGGRNIIWWSGITTRNYFFDNGEDNSIKPGNRIINHNNYLGTKNTPFDTDDEKENSEIGFMQILAKFTEKDVQYDQKRFRNTVLVLADVNPFLTEKNPDHIRFLRECLWAIQSDYKTIILLGQAVTVPPDLQNDFISPEFPLPTFLELKKTITDKMQAAFPKIQLDNESLEHFARGCTGLTKEVAIQTLFNAVVEFKGINKEAVQFAYKEKEQIVKRSGIAEITPPKGGLEMLGGLQHFKQYVLEVDKIFNNQEKAIAYGADVPSGIMLMGVSGTGKSLGAKALSGHWNLPNLNLDIGRMFGSLVGQSESNFRRFQDLAKAIAPCLVFIDEFEKGIGGSGERDGGTSERVKGALLTWLQDKPNNIIVVATVNSIEPFEKNPEMLRAGRFDSIWFVDLPDSKSREEIFKIHLNRVKHLHNELDFTELVRATRAYSGAEIENIVKNAVRRAFNQDLPHPTTSLLLESIKETVPLSKTMTHVLKKLREYCQEGKARRAGDSIEHDAQEKENTDTTNKPNLLLDNTDNTNGVPIVDTKGD